MNWLADDLYELIRPILIAEERREERERRGWVCFVSRRSADIPVWRRSVRCTCPINQHNTNYDSRGSCVRWRRQLEISFE